MAIYDLDIWHRAAAAALSLAILLTAFACGGAETSEDAGTSAPADAAGTEASRPAPAAGDANAPAAADAAVPAEAPAPAGKAPPPVTSLGEQPIAAGDLHAAYFHWSGQTVTVVGYPYVYMPSGRGRWSRRIELTPEPEPQTPALLNCRLDEDEVPEGRLTSDTVLTVRGRIRDAGWGRTFGEPPNVVLDDGCELVSTGGEVPSGGDPWTLGPDPIPVKALNKAMFRWQGETVRVVGYYGGTTTSTPGFDPARTRTSHGLKTDAGGKGVVHCNHPGEVAAPASVVASREGTIVEGTIGEPNGSVVVLDDCRIVEGS